MTSTIADLNSVRGFLRGWCSSDVALDELGVEHVNPGPDGSLRALYEGPGPRGQVLRVTALRLGPERGRRLEAEINGRRPPPHGEAPTGFSQPAIYVPELSLLFSVFPADRRLETLPTAADGRAMAPVLETALAGSTGGVKVRQAVVHPLRYKPQRKCLFRYEIEWAAANGRELPAIVYARVARRSKFERSGEILPRLHDAAARAGPAFDLPEPLGLVPELCMQLFSHVPGVRLFTLIETPGFPSLCERVGAALHEFHSLPVLLDGRRDPAVTVAGLARTAREFTRLLPGARDRIDALRRALTAALENSPPQPLRPIHGDFHGDNILIDGERIALVDLEDCVMGDPADDVASNWAQLTWRAAGAPARTSLPAAGRRAFLGAYVERADAAMATRLRVRAALHCFTGAYQCLRRPADPDRFENAEIMLAACEDVLERGLR